MNDIDFRLLSQATQYYVNGTTLDGNIFSDFFGQETTEADSIPLELEIDSMRAAELAESPNDEYQIIDKDNVHVAVVRPGQIKRRMTFTQLDALQRIWGQTSGQTVGSAEAHRRNVTRRLRQGLAHMYRGFEKLAVNVLKTGVVMTSPSEAYDMGKHASLKVAANELTGNDLWSNNASDPIDQIRGWIGKMMARRNIPTDILLGHEAARALYKNENFLKYADNRRFVVTSIDDTRPRLMANSQRGKIIEDLNVWICAAAYRDENGDMVNYIDPKTVLLVRKDLDVNKIIFGKTGRRDQTTVQPIQTIIGENVDDSVPIITFHSAPVALTKDPDSALEAKVLA